MCYGCTRSLSPVAIAPKPPQCQIWSSLSAWEMFYWDTMSDTHCFQSINNTLLVYLYLERQKFYRYLSDCFVSFGAIIILLYRGKSTKMPDLGYTLSLSNGVMVNKVSQQLLLKCFKTMLGCLHQEGEAGKGT